MPRKKVTDVSGNGGLKRKRASGKRKERDFSSDDEFDYEQENNKKPSKPSAKSGLQPVTVADDVKEKIVGLIYFLKTNSSSFLFRKSVRIMCLKYNFFFYYNFFIFHLAVQSETLPGLNLEEIMLLFLCAFVRSLLIHLLLLDHQYNIMVHIYNCMLQFSPGCSDSKCLENFFK